MERAAVPEYFFTTMPSPVGKLKLFASDRGLRALLFDDERPDRVPLPAARERPDHPVLVEAKRQLDEYFAGKRVAFELDLEFAGTAFQKRVWAALLTIPVGETRTYGEIATQLGNPSAMRAVGAANGRNPIAIVAPCHRVIGASGKLVGFGGGLPVKAALLDLERADLALPFEPTPIPSG